MRVAQEEKCKLFISCAGYKPGDYLLVQHGSCSPTNSTLIGDFVSKYCLVPNGLLADEVLLKEHILE